MYGRVKNRAELQVPAGKEGADQILNDLFAYGSTKLDRIAFQEALDEIGANAQAGTSFSLEVLPDGFARGVELLADNLLHPALPEAAFKAVQQRTAQAVAGQLQSPVYRSGRTFLKAIYPEKDPTLREATPDTIGALTLEDVRSYHEKAFRPDLTTIVVIGKVTPEHARAVIEKYFASWQATGPKPETDLPPVPRNKASATSSRTEAGFKTKSPWPDLRAAAPRRRLLRDAARSAGSVRWILRQPAVPGFTRKKRPGLLG